MDVAALQRRIAELEIENRYLQEVLHIRTVAARHRTEVRVHSVSHIPNDSVVSRRRRSRKYGGRGLVEADVLLQACRPSPGRRHGGVFGRARDRGVVGLCAPATDGQGYVDSTARCASPNAAVLFGSTETSRVVICKTRGGEYEYRGVRVRDGAKLIVPASQSGNEGFVADNDGVTYTVTAKSLVVSAGNKVIREEPMADVHRPETPAAPAAPPTTTSPTTPLPPPLPAEVGGGR